MLELGVEPCGARETWSPPHSAAMDWSIDLSESVCLVLDVCLLFERRCDMSHGVARFACAAATRRSLIVLEPGAVLNVERHGLRHALNSRPMGARSRQEGDVARR